MAAFAKPCGLRLFPAVQTKSEYQYFQLNRQLSSPLQICDFWLQSQIYCPKFRRIFVRFAVGIPFAAPHSNLRILPIVLLLLLLGIKSQTGPHTWVSLIFGKRSD